MGDQIFDEATLSPEEQEAVVYDECRRAEKFFMGVFVIVAMGLLVIMATPKSASHWIIPVYMISSFIILFVSRKSVDDYKDRLHESISKKQLPPKAHRIGST